jgi:hypothetical protein
MIGAHKMIIQKNIFYIASEQMIWKNEKKREKTRLHNAKLKNQKKFSKRGW